MRPTPHPSAPSGRRLGLALLVALAAAVLAGNGTAAVVSTMAPGWAGDLDRLAPVVIAAVYAAVIGALLVVLGRTRPQRQGLLALRPVPLRAVGYGIAVWAGAYALAGVLYLVSGAFGGPGLDDVVDVLMAVGADNARLHQASALLVAVILVRILVLSPIAEELLFRGALYTWLRTRLSAPWTIALTAAGFGLLHQHPVFVPLAVVVGAAAGWIRERTGSSAVPVVVHALQSGAVVLASLAATGWDTPRLLG